MFASLLTSVDELMMRWRVGQTVSLLENLMGGGLSFTGAQLQGRHFDRLNANGIQARLEFQTTPFLVLSVERFAAHNVLTQKLRSD
jgi:hypothetical protein